MKQQILSQGAEAIIYKKDNIVIKDRVAKSYRLKELDEKIRKRRTKKEIKLLEKASKIILAPKPIKSNSSFEIQLPLIKGKKLSDHLDNFPMKEQLEICNLIGISISKIHENNIIHGDLTTSNMILFEEYNLEDEKLLATKMAGSGAKETPDKKLKGKANNHEKLKVYFIDFGLGFESNKLEDKAVDLHLIKQALEAKHFSHWKTLWNSVEKAYSKSSSGKQVLERLRKVESRGRYKDKY